MNFQINNFSEIKSETIICFIYEDYKKSELFEYLNNLSNNELNKQINSGIFKGKYLETFKIALNNNLKVVFEGLGKYEELTRKNFSIAAADAARYAKKISESKIAFEIASVKDVNNEDSAKIILSAAAIGLYEFDKYLSNKSKKIETIELLSNNINTEIEKGALVGISIANAMNFTKDLVNEPAQNATPAYISEIAQEVAAKNNLEIKV